MARYSLPFVYFLPLKTSFICSKSWLAVIFMILFLLRLCDLYLSLFSSLQFVSTSYFIFLSLYILFHLYVQVHCSYYFSQCTFVMSMMINLLFFRIEFYLFIFLSLGILVMYILIINVFCLLVRKYFWYARLWCLSSYFKGLAILSLKHNGTNRKWYMLFM